MRLPPRDRLRGRRARRRRPAAARGPSRRLPAVPAAGGRGTDALDRGAKPARSPAAPWPRVPGPPPLAEAGRPAAPRLDPVDGGDAGARLVGTRRLVLRRLGGRPRSRALLR